jgi:hypothetical protein
LLDSARKARGVMALMVSGSWVNTNARQGSVRSPLAINCRCSAAKKINELCPRNAGRSLTFCGGWKWSSPVSEHHETWSLTVWRCFAACLSCALGFYQHAFPFVLRNQEETTR